MYMRDAADARSCVAFLYAGRPPITKPEPEPMGTCFFGKAEGIEGGTGIDYLITAAHVLDDLREADRKTKCGASVRLNVPGGGVDWQSLPLDESAWLEHDDAAVDVAVHRWSGGQLESFEIGFIDVDSLLVGGGNDMARVGDDAAFFGLMINFAGRRRNLLALRVGTVSLITDELIRGPRGDSNYHIIDAQSYKGNSGAPVWEVSGGAFRLWGVLSAGYPTKAELIKKDTSTSRREEYYNLGMSWVTPIGKVADILKEDVERKRIRKERDKKGTPVPLSTAGGFTRADMESALQKVSRKTKPSRSGRGKRRT